MANKVEQRQIDKQLRETYRDRAKALAERILFTTRATGDPLDVQVTPNGSIKVMEDGAFVEAVIWIPREKL